MERNFAGGGQQGGYAGVNVPAMLPVDEAYLNGYLSELSFQSILQPLCPYDGGLPLSSQSPTPAALDSPSFSPATYGYFDQDFTETTTPEPPTTYQFLNPEELKMSKHEDFTETTTPEPPTTYQYLNPKELKMPKHEGLSTQDFAFQLLKLDETTPYSAVSAPEDLINFFSTTATSSVDDLRSGGCFTDQAHYLTGSLKDIMNVQLTQSTTFPSRTQRVESGSAAASAPWMNMKRYMPYKSSELARKRRQRISEKTRCLQRVLPWDKKMDMGTMLEEAYKYIKFLQAQISVLQNMPHKTTSTITSSGPGGGSQNPSYYNVSNSSSSGNVNDVVWGELGKLNRQQLLDVVVNSPVTQTVLYSRGCCVYSMEQLVLLKKMAEKKAQLEQQVLFASPLLF